CAQQDGIRRPSMFYDDQVQARSYAPGIGQAVADRTINRRITKAFEPRQPVNVTLPRDDASSLDNQVAAWVKSNGYVFDGDYDVHAGDGDHVALTVYMTGKIVTESW